MEVNITASTSEKFEEIKAHLDSLPDKIKSQICKAEKGLAGFDYTLAEQNSKVEPKIFVPKNHVKTINQYENFTMIFCDDYFLRIEGNLHKARLHYVFVEPTKSID